ncbi:MAG: peptidoglycan-binding protein [Pseudonocardia sp.]|nr:peptidoglycan-binding protein [Pseudonocardia sp.]
MMKAVVRFLLPAAVVTSVSFSAAGIAAAAPVPAPASVDWHNCGVQQMWMRGECVTILQQRLGVPADGIYGPQTRDAVVRYQQAHHPPMLVDGKAGPEVYTSLFYGAARAR